MAQVNQIYNSGFENGPTRANHNLITPSNSGNAVGWLDAGGQSLNVVQVDGPNGFDYKNNGPENDAKGTATPAAPRRYLDIVGGSNTVFQRITPKCSGPVQFGAYFSTRADNSGQGSVRIVQGISPAGATVGASVPVSLPRGKSKTDPWKLSSGNANLTAGKTYTFAVTMDNNLNMDEAYVFFEDCKQYPDLPDVKDPNWGNGPPPIDTQPNQGDFVLNPFPVLGDGNQPDKPAEAINPCCAPWNPKKLGDSLLYRGSGSINQPYTLEFNPAHTLDGHVSEIPALQAYLNYMNAVNPNINKLNIQVHLYDQGNNPWPVSHTNAIGQSYYAQGNGPAVGPVSGIVLTANSNTVAKHVNYSPTSHVFVGTSIPGANPGSYPMKVGQWYLVHTGIWTDKERFFGKDCDNVDYFIRIQSMQKSTSGGGGYILQTIKQNSKKVDEKLLDIIAAPNQNRRK